MKPAAFEYHAPTSVSDALLLLGELDNARPLAGGQSMIPMMNFRFLQPDHVVDLGHIEELKSVAVKGSMATCGAMTTQADIIADTALAKHVPILKTALHYTGHRQTRNRGTIGGSLCHLDPTAELAACARLLDAEFLLRGAASGERRLPFDDFAQGYMENGADDHELLVAVEFPIWGGKHGYAFHEVARRHGDFAIVAAGALLETDWRGRIKRAAITLAGMQTLPLRLYDLEASLVGQRPSDDLFKQTATQVQVEDVLSDPYASDGYRRHLAKVLTKRVLIEAATRIGAKRG